MSRFSKIRSLILQHLLKRARSGAQASSKELLQAVLQVEEKLSLRQLQRYLQALVEEGKIDYNSHYQSYSIDEEHFESEALGFEKLERALAYASILGESNHYHPLGHPILAFEAYHNFRGAENLTELLDAIRANRLIAFRYRHYYRPQAQSDRLVAPLFLKEYLNRWYLVGWDWPKDRQRIFGIDRIIDLKLSDQEFDPLAYYQTAWDQFADVIGLRSSDGDQAYVPMDLVIRSEAVHCAYLDSLPLHASQEKIPGPGNQTRYRYRVVPNFELEQRLLSFSHLIEVEEPRWYREQFAQKLATIHKMYRSA